MANDDLSWFLKHARNEREAKTAYYAETGFPMAEIGEKSGYSGGKSDDPAKRKATFAAAASRAVGSRRIRQLREQFRAFKLAGDNPVATKDELMQRLSAIVRGSNDPAAINAAKALLEDHRRAPPNIVTPDLMRRLVDEACRREAPLLRVIGVASGLMWRAGGVPEMNDWQPPADCEDMARLIESGVGPGQVVSLLQRTLEQDDG